MKQFILYLLLAICQTALSQEKKVYANELQKPVEILIDRYGVPHIYAQTENDLFFAQGYKAAKDRLFQFELFRRRATGTLSEIVGKRELARDIGSRLFKYRGNIKEELNHYHPHGEKIIQSFVNGINAYIKQVLDNEMPMPVELKLLGIKPGYWTTEVVISRHNGLLGNVQEELETARLKNKIGEKMLRAISNFHPNNPDLRIDSTIDLERLNDNVLQYYNSFKAPLKFLSEDIASADRNENSATLLSTKIGESNYVNESEGSNNWVIDGKHTMSNFPMLANDPHRAITTPSLRYIVHLSAPGWNVIGGGEPILPGVSIGHNDYGAWGLTIFPTDAEDIYVYKLRPDNPSMYYYNGTWKSFKIIKDTIQVKNKGAQVVNLFYSVHGPVSFIDSTHHLAYAVKCGWLEKGCAPYLASLRINQAKSWNEFRDACRYSYIPAENMVWADKKGTIGWQTVGIAPIRNHHSGMVPVPGDGRFEWSGYLPVLQRPYEVNPSTGFIITANENRTPNDYPFMNTIGYSWADDYRHDRIKEVLSGGSTFNLDDMMKLQTDYYSIPARELVTLLKDAKTKDSLLLVTKETLEHWDYLLEPNSSVASIYFQWENCLEKNLLKKLNLDTISKPAISIGTKQLIEFLKNPNTLPIENLLQDRNMFLLESLRDAIIILKNKLGPNADNWQYGQLAMKHVLIKHPLSTVVSTKVNDGFTIGPYPRGGNGNTVNSTGDSLRQLSGASFRVIIDCADWDQTICTNSLGQSGDPQSVHYRDLFELWKKNLYFPLYFSKEKIESVKESSIRLLPGNKQSNKINKNKVKLKAH